MGKRHHTWTFNCKGTANLSKVEEGEGLENRVMRGYPELCGARVERSSETLRYAGGRETYLGTELISGVSN